jgi:hypothetical protein
MTGAAVAALLALQTLTNLALVPAGPGLPGGWRLQRVKGAAAPAVAVTGAHALRVTTARGAGFAVYRLRTPLPPAVGALAWQWRTSTPLRAAGLRRRDRDDAPVRVLVVFQDGRMLFYTWGNREGRRERFLSWTGTDRGVIVLERAEDADGSWHIERRDPFRDYRLVFNRAPQAIVAVGVGADTDQLGARSAAEVGDVAWEPGAEP